MGINRHPPLPGVPTFEELGYKGFDGVQCYGTVGPTKMRPAVVAALNKAINDALGDPKLREKLSSERWSRCG
jgi:tripartite-type tricarboxylate transporter receptor subunit TctC